jgi:CubicO group peptidase (beta-lactamase class C family)
MIFRWRFIPFLLLASSAALAQQTVEQATPQCAFPAASLGGTVDAHTRFVETNLLPAFQEPGTQPFALEERMRAYAVPGVSVAVIRAGKLEWARGWGVRDLNSCAPVTPETDFQAASISKVVTALTAMRLVEQGKLNLDEDINHGLTSWKLAPDPRLAPQGVTLRELLSHTAGLNVWGFPGYAVGAPLPSVVQVLDGAPPANSEAVKIGLPVGQQWHYSGGGYVIARVALEDATGVPFDRLAQREVLEPLGMRRSAFAQPPSKAILSNVALGHVGGKVIAGGYRVYPELAPDGLWTTPSDLARLLIGIQASAHGRSSKLLAPKSTAQMLAPVKSDWALHTMLHGVSVDGRFGHDGVNEGFEATMVMQVETGNGVVVMTNGANGKHLADEIIRAVSLEYGWNGLVDPPIVEAHVPPEALASLAGRYEANGAAVDLEIRDAHLFVQSGGPMQEPLVALTAQRFKARYSGIVVEFERAADGKGSGFRILEGYPPMTFVRSLDAASAQQGR